MIKKIMIDKEDRQKLKTWERKRINSIDDFLAYLRKEKEEYVVSFDIASEGSTDQSVMVKFKVVDGQYVFEGFESI